MMATISSQRPKLSAAQPLQPFNAPFDRRQAFEHHLF
jgi:hypothetical protein